MLIVRVELWSAITGKTTELARMGICNVGGSDNPRRSDYRAVAWRGRSSAALNKRVTGRTGRVENHARLSLHVWHLVAKALASMGYGA